MINYKCCSDEDLLYLLKNNNEHSFSEIYRRYESNLIHYAVQITHNKEDAADIVQEIFVSLWNRRSTVIISHSLHSWLYKAVRFQSAKYIHKNIAEKDYLQHIDMYLQVCDTASPDILLENTEQIEMINRRIEEMPKRMKEIYVLSRQENLTHREISVQLNIAEGTVKKQIQNALKFLKEKSFADFIVTAFFILSFFKN